MKLYNFLYFLFCMVSASALTAQNLIPHQYSLGSTGSNSVGKPIIDNEGNYYLFINVSMFSSAHNTGNLGTFQYGSNFFVISKHKSDHELIWRKAYGGDSLDYFGGAVITDDGLLISSLSNSPVSGTKTIGSNGYFHIWLQKIDFEGNDIWQKGIFTESNLQGSSIYKLNGNEYLVSTSAQAGISGDKTSYGYAEYDGWLIKVDELGTILWDATIGTNENDFTFEIAGNFQNNDVLLAAFSSANTSGAKTENNYGEINFWLIRLDVQNGSVIWDKTIGSGGTGESLGEVKLVEDEIFIITGSRGGVSGLRSLSLKGIQDIWFVKMDSDANIIEQKCFGGSETESGANIGLIEDNYILSLVRSNSNTSIDKNEDSRGLNDLWLVRSDLNGNILNQKTIGGSDNDYGIGVVVLPNGNYLITASSRSGVSGEKTVPRIGSNSSDVWILEIDAVTLDIVNEHQIMNESVLFPNPASNQINISFTEPTKLNKAVLYDLSGKVVLEQDLSASFEANYVLNTQGLASGVYSLSLVGDGFVKTQQVVVQ